MMHGQTQIKFFFQARGGGAILTVVWVISVSKLA